MVQTKGFAGEVDLAFGVSEQNREIQFESQAHLSNGRLLHPMVPYPLDNISGDIFCRKGLLQLRNCNASSGDAAIRLECDMNGFGPGSPLAATATIQNLALDDRLYQALPAALQEHWKRMGIQGTVDASAAIQFDGQKWNPRVLVRARNAGIHADFFPYPVTGLQGDFLYENGRIHAPELTAVAGEQRLSGSLTLQKAEPRWLMDLILAADGPVAIDETLMRALSSERASKWFPKVCSFVASDGYGTATSRSLYPLGRESRSDLQIARVDLFRVLDPIRWVSVSDCRCPRPSYLGQRSIGAP